MNFNVDLMTFLQRKDAYEVLQSLNVLVKEEDGLRLLKYHQFDTPKNHLTNQCRGTIVNDDRIVCRGFYRFFNYGEPEASDIDWSTAVVQEKLDGSLIRFYYYHGWWRIATSGNIDAVNATIDTVTYDTFHSIVSEYLDDHDLWKEVNTFDTDYTYLFELTSPYNRVVVPYTETTLTFLSRIHNESGTEDIVNHTAFPSVTCYDVQKDECFSNVSNMPYSQEGYVVRDAQGRRIKVKSPAYVHVHKLKGDATPSPRIIVEMIQEGEDAEFLSYFPEYKEDFAYVRSKIMCFVSQAEMAYALCKNVPRKDVMKVADQVYAPYVFARRDNKVQDAWQFFFTMYSKTQLKMLERL